MSEQELDLLQFSSSRTAGDGTFPRAFVAGTVNVPSVTVFVTVLRLSEFANLCHLRKALPELPFDVGCGRRPLPGCVRLSSPRTILCVFRLESEQTSQSHLSAIMTRSATWSNSGATFGNAA